VGPIVAIALNTFREAVRDRVLYIMLLFAVGLILFSLLLGELAPREQVRLTVDVGLAAISLMSVLLAIVLGGTHLHKEIERKTVYFILPQPIGRWQFLAGKFLGLVWVLAITIAVMGGTLLTVLAWHDPSLQTWVGAVALLDIAAVVVLAVALRRRPILWPALLAGWMVLTGFVLATRAEANVALLAQGLCLVATEAVVVSSIALLFSSFSTPFLSGMLTFLVFVAGRQLQWLESLAARIDDAGVDALLHLVALVFPNTYLFVPSVNVLEGRLVIANAPAAPWELVAHAAAYGALYSAIVLGIAGFVLWRRDFV
jgi:ABC-type transport system involved in multi-copper enzyme maturation permease subunit